MNYIEGIEELKIVRVKKMMFWFGIISLFMSFVGLMSVYVVSKERGDWLESLVFLEVFYVSFVVIIMSSLIMYFVKKMVI